ncbi:MAG: hypothetical protein D6824_04785 [Planctomycetota bacterium]|nr:MAG: hypothetical protein D6824_04785 [Planctomycetota bacterium]
MLLRVEALTVAQRAPAAAAAVWAAVILIAAVALLAGALWFRRWLQSRMDAPSSEPSLLTLQQIRALHAAGTITSEERDALRAAAMTRTLGNGRAAAAQTDGGSGETCLRAPPGVDLTGEPLPRVDAPLEEDEDGPENPRPSSPS